MNYKLLLQLEMEETKRLREELALTKLKLEVAESRVKPEEPQFKAGDFVRDIISGKVSQVKNEDIVNGVYSQVIKWEPQAGELVVIKNKDDTISIINYNGETGVVPFIGEKTWLLKTN